MRAVVADELWIGNTADAQDLGHILETGILALVDLRLEELPPQLTRDLVYCRFPMIDGSGNAPWLLKAAVDTIVSVIRGQVPTLVFCASGMSRSPSFVAAALALVSGQPPQVTLASVTTGYPHDVSASLWSEINQACF